MDKETKTELYELVKEKCRGFDEKFGHTDVWRYHIEPVVKNAMLLASKFGADLEIVEIGALLHDIASLEDFGKYAEEHHIIGSIMAEEILTKYNYPKDKLERVKKCVLNHRASSPKNSIEEICVADADAVSHIVNVPELLMWRAMIGETVEQGSNFVKNKITKSFNKMSKQSQEFYRERFNAILQVFEQE